MAIWNPTQILSVNDGTVANDGTGDPIRDAFIKVNENFSNVSTFLAQTSIDFLNSNVQQTLNAGTIHANVLTTVLVDSQSLFNTGNITSNNLIANLGIYNSGITVNQGNTYLSNLQVNGTSTFAGSGNVYVSTNIIPTANLTYDLGSTSNYFRNIYAQGIINVNTVTASSDAGLLELHANLAPGDVKDVGIFGKYYISSSSSNAFAFFGFQDASNNFVYKQTTTDATLGNSVVYDGVYGNTQFGSQYLSNITPSVSSTTGALIVAGGAGIAGNVYSPQFYGNISSTIGNIARLTVSGSIGGNLNVDGNIFSAGNPVVTINSPGVGIFYNGGSIFSSNVVINVNSQSTSPSTGALVIVSSGGAGIGGNIYSGGNIVATGNVSGSALVGPVYGTIQTASQPNITSVGTLSSLNAGSISATSVGTTNLTATGSVNFTGATITGLGAISTTGNITAGNIIATTQFQGSLLGTILQSSQPNITSLGNLTLLNVSGNTTISGNTVVNNTFYGRGVYDNGSRVISSISITAGNGLSGGGTVTGPSGTITLTNAGVTALTSGTGVSLTGNTGAITITNTGLISASAGVGISVSGTNPLIITNTGVQSIVAGGNISISSNTGNVTISGTNAGVTGAFAGNGISVSNSVGGVTITNTGLISASAGVGISVSGTNPLVITNTGVQSIVAGTDITISSNVGNITVNNTSNLATVTSRGATTSTPVTFNGQINTGANIVPTANVTYNIGSNVAWFNQFYGVATYAQYADLAERYIADANYEPGTVVVFGGDQEITVTNTFADATVAGAISTDPAYLMNAASDGLPVALRGKIPLKVVGPVYKGDSLVTANAAPGYAASVGNSISTYGQAIFAKSLTTDLSLGEKIIIAVIL